ncbi:unnamed protein product, partial [Adineta steineri]
LSTGHVFHAEILRHQISSNENENNSNESVINSDVLLIAFHHAASDRASSSIFFNDLCFAYNTNATSIEDDEESLQYIDYSIHERLIDMTTSRTFWYLQLEGYNWESRLSLPVDRHRVSNDHRSSSASITQISFDNDISQSFLDYASLHHVTPFQLGLSILYAFLFKLTHGESDLCISCLNANRHKNELQNIMGMFVSTLPYRIQLDPHWSFDELVMCVREKCLSILEHSHYPLQHILANIHINQSNISFLETMYDFITISSHSNELSLDGTSLKQVSFKQSLEVAKFDFMLTFIYNPMLENNRLSFHLTCSYDLFDEITVTSIGRRLEYCFQQLFSSNQTINRIGTCFTSVSKFDLILPEETEEMEDIIFYRQSHIMNEAPASFAQALLWHNRCVHFTPNISQVPIYNMPFVYSLYSYHTLSAEHLRHALQLIVIKHEALRTSLTFHTENNRLMQQIIDFNQNHNTLFTIIESTYTTHEQLNHIIHEEKYNPQLFDAAQGLVFRCHLVYYKQISSNHLLSDKDILIFNFHHSVFDYPSMNIFLHDLNQAYTTGQLLYDDNTNLRYLDYAAIEHQMSMTGASMFWLDALHDCKLDQPLLLPFDRYRLSNEQRTCLTTSISFDFGQDLSHDFLIHASSNNIPLEHVMFAIYFMFLFKLTSGQTDLCVAMNINNNRYRDELKSIVGLFENVIPLRCQLDPHWGFHQLLEHVQEITTNSMKYSYFPLQRILNQHPHISKHAFLDTSLEFISNRSNNDYDAIMIGDSQMIPGSFSFNINENEILSASDFSFSVYHDLNMDQLSCTINASLDLFNVETIDKISQRFHSMLNQLFISVDDQMNKPIYEISLTLSNERLLMQSLNNTQVSYSSAVTCIHHEFVSQVMKHPQKLAVELDEQSLTYTELLYYVQVLSLYLINKYHVVPGEIICQCVERSLSMVIGIMGIEMAGCVYCPLSPRDPQHRLHALTQQTQSRLVLVHHLTKTKFNDDIISLDIDSVITSCTSECVIDVNRLSKVITVSDDVAYIIFTSGSTGTPKAAQTRHRNFTNFVHSIQNAAVLNEQDTVSQICAPTYDVHVMEIMGSLLLCATVVMLHPYGNMDFEYFAHTLQHKQITCFAPVPTFLNHLCDFLAHSNRYPLPSVRSLCIGGEPFSQKLVHRLRSHIKTIREEGELFIGGVGVFAGYLGRDDLTAKALVEIDGELFYRTGDLVRMDNNGLLHFQGRKDHQIKLHGQRIELGEIERCLLNITAISVCVVMKWNDDYLVAYVQSSDINEQELREHCQSHLPPHMIPSIFIILDKLPLNPNGKIDRKLLPPPNFSSIQLTSNIDLLTPSNENEIIIHHIWCDLFKQKQISTNTNIFTLGGHSLIIMQLFHQYKIQFHLETNTLSITDLFQHPTIIDHAQLIYQTMNMTKNINDCHWSPLQIIQAKASFAQERIFLDEQIRFSSANNNTNMYVIPLIYRVSSMNDHISISRLQHAFQSVITKHQILRTALYLDTNGTIMQHYLDANTSFNDKKSSRFSIIHHSDEEHEENEIVKKILSQSDLFDLSKGHVINCHILRRQQSNHSLTHNNDDLLTKDDRILFTFHHACFDGASTSVFIRDLPLAYQSNELLSIDDNSLQYIDYSIHEHIMDMTLSQEFWLLELKGYNLTHQLPLPVDRQRLSTDQRSGLASLARITFDNDICTSFLNYASSHHLTLFQLGLSVFHVFLFKLTHGESDLCISSINANRYRSELVNMIGMFVSTLPYRLEINSNWSFDEVVEYVQEKCLSILEHSHYPLQHILSNLHMNQSNVSFLEILFDFITISEEMNDLCLNGVRLQEVSLNDSYEMAKFDFFLNFIYNPSSHDNHLCCSFICSSDLFDGTTLTTIGRRFQHILEQLFSSKSSTNCIDLYCTSISKVDLILPEEVEERQAIMFHRLENISNEEPASFAQCRIWSENQRDTDTDQSSLITHNIPYFYRLCTGDILSVEQLRRALQLILNKHESLHTSLIYDSNKNILMQRVLTQQDINDDMFTVTESTYETDEQLNVIIENEKCNPQLFDLVQGLVFRCHIIYYRQISSNKMLSDKDIIIFNFHHAFFDYPSINIFLHDLDQAYKTGQLTTDNATTLRYIDYALIEQQMSMTSAHMYWLDALHDSHLDQSLSLPYDRYRLINEHRTDRSTSIAFDFGQDLSHHFLNYTSSNNIKHQHLALATYFIFLFKLTNGDKDLCIAMNIDNRYRDELKSIIGLFENIIPLRCQLDPHWSFHYLLDYVREITTNSIKYSYFPLQCILNQHPTISKPAFLDISFQFLSSMKKTDNKLIIVGDSHLSSIPSAMNIDENEIIDKYDFSLLIQHDLNANQLSCTINATLDLFNVETIDKISQRFHSMLKQLFTSVDNQMNTPIYEISVTLSNERLLVQSMNNAQVSFPSAVTCIHHAFVYQVMKHPQKLAVELDEQSLTYSELLHYVQVLSLHLIKKYVVVPCEIICQCVERSLSMVIGIMAIEMAGGVYCPLSPRDPQHRLHTLIEQTQARLVLVHWLSKKQVDDDITTFDISSTLVNHDMCIVVDVNQLSNVTITPENIAYIIFTSGSTGIPKAIQTRHRNFSNFIHSLHHTRALNGQDVVVQICAPTYDVHVMEIIGEPISMKLVHRLRNHIQKKCDIYNIYAPAETTVVSIYHCIELISLETSVPLGRPLPNEQYKILDMFFQSIANGQEGELFIGGVGIFAGYLNRDDLTKKALIKIDNEFFYRSGDLVKTDRQGYIHYITRKDFQIKLRGQRIELGEIERCLLETTVSACVAIKWNDDHLVAYVQSSDIAEKQLRDHCESHLPPHMIPSYFIILDKLPLNANGKIDRKFLPSLNFSSSSIDHVDNVPYTILEQQLQDIFSQAFHIQSPRVEAPFNQLGGTSLDAIRVLALIRQQLCTNIDIGLFFTNPSIRQLAQAIEPLLILNAPQENASTVNEIYETHLHFSPSFVIESVGIVFLICQWLWPIIIIHRWCPLFFPILPAFHLLFYVICSRLFSPCYIQTDNLFSWSYYRWWFLDRLWNNNTFWLQHILGTPLYNYYLRLCGARISPNTHIYTTIIDAPWLLEIGDGAWIANETY